MRDLCADPRLGLCHIRGFYDPGHEELTLLDFYVKAQSHSPKFADVRRIGALRDSRFWAAQNSASRKRLRSIALIYVFFA